ncbi:hypothetical protein OA066_03070 [SAR86 cluster bacterium]|nr:hypothetical protein [SAR86 cluster bacterium]
MKDVELRLFPNIDLNSLKKKSLSMKELKYPTFTSDQYIIYSLIHNHSNYEDIMWVLYKEEKKYVLGQLKNLLYEISKLDSKLTWDCQIIFERYKRDYERKHSKSSWIKH